MLGILEGEPSLNLSGENGMVRTLLGARDGGASLALYDENGKERAGLVVLKRGRPRLVLFDDKEDW